MRNDGHFNLVGCFGLFVLIAHNVGWVHLIDSIRCQSKVSNVRILRAMALWPVENFFRGDQNPSTSFQLFILFDIDVIMKQKKNGMPNKDVGPKAFVFPLSFASNCQFYSTPPLMAFCFFSIFPFPICRK